jgi:hypothetical protein
MRLPKYPPLTLNSLFVSRFERGCLSRHPFVFALLFLVHETCRSQIVFSPTQVSPYNGFRYRCVLPKGWISGPNSSVTFIDRVLKVQPIFHCKKGDSLLSLSAVVDPGVDDLSKDVLANYDVFLRKGLVVQRTEISTGLLYAFFVRKKPMRVPLWQPFLQPSNGLKSAPRYYAEVYVLAKGKVFLVTGSSTNRDIVQDAISVAMSYRPLDKS